jgi:hypothetical protein
MSTKVETHMAATRNVLFMIKDEPLYMLNLYPLAGLAVLKRTSYGPLES